MFRTMPKLVESNTGQGDWSNLDQKLKRPCRKNTELAKQWLGADKEEKHKLFMQVLQASSQSIISVSVPAMHLQSCFWFTSSTKLSCFRACRREALKLLMLNWSAWRRRRMKCLDLWKLFIGVVLWSSIYFICLYCATVACCFAIRVNIFAITAATSKNQNSHVSANIWSGKKPTSFFPKKTWKGKAGPKHGSEPSSNGILTKFRIMLLCSTLMECLASSSQLQVFELWIVKVRR